MAIAIWDDSFRTGHSLVDEQHQELFRMINQLHQAIVSGKGREALGRTLERLKNYTVTHFAAEESLMAASQYPHLALHKRKHDALTAKATKIIENYKHGKMVLTLTLSQFLSDWLRHHISEDDKALVNYLNQRKLEAA